MLAEEGYSEKNHKKTKLAGQRDGGNRTRESRKIDQEMIWKREP